LSLPMKAKTDKITLLSNPEALKILREYVEREREKTGAVPLIAQRVLDYLQKFSKVPVEKASEFREKLASLGLREESIVMIMNICPQTIDELFTLLVFEEKTPEKENLEAILSLVKEYCLQSQ